MQCYITISVQPSCMTRHEITRLMELKYSLLIIRERIKACSAIVESKFSAGEFWVYSISQYMQCPSLDPKLSMSMMQPLLHACSG